MNNLNNLTDNDFKQLFNLPPEKAINYLKNKGLYISEHWRDTLDEAHARSFTVAKMANLTALSDIRKKLIGAMENGGYQREFLKQMADSELPKYRLKTIFRTNMRSAVASGRYAQMWENRETHPYWQYIAILDNRTRPHHRAINGVIKAADDAFWQSNYPPNGFNCRCTVRALTADAAQSRGGISENTAPFQPDEGFSHSPIQAATIEKIWVEKAKNEPELLRQIAKDLTSEPRVAGFNAFIRTAQRNGYAQNRAYAVGLLDAKAAEKLGADNPLVVFLDKLISGRKVERHSAAENNLKDADFERIIRQFAHADYTLWDTRNRHLLLIFRQPETKNVIKLSLNNVDKETRVISAFSVPEYTVTDAIKSREFVPIE